MLGATVPEVAINEHRYTVSRQHQVRRTGLRDAAMEPDPRPLRMERAAQQDLRLGALRLASLQVPTLRGSHPDTLGHGFEYPHRMGEDCPSAVFREATRAPADAPTVMP